MALVSLVFFLHSNATWSLHSLWQFIPQSAWARRYAQHVRNRNSSLTSASWLSTDFSLNAICSANAVLWALHAYCQGNKQLSGLLRDGGGGKTVVLAADCFFFFVIFFFFMCCKVSASSVQHRKTTVHLLNIAPLHLLPTRGCVYLFILTRYLLADIWPTIDTHMMKCHNYLCICSLAWWHPTAVI